VRTGVQAATVVVVLDSSLPARGPHSEQSGLTAAGFFSRISETIAGADSGEDKRYILPNDV